MTSPPLLRENVIYERIQHLPPTLISFSSFYHRKVFVFRFSTTTADPYDAPEDDWFGGGGGEDDYNYEDNDEDYYEADGDGFGDDGFGDDGFGDDGFGDSGDGAGDGFDDFEEDSDDEWDW